MKLLELFLAFLKIGLFTFGGAYAAIPLIREEVLARGWLSEEMFSYFVGVSESTPGPIMVNMATYVGSSRAGFWGALCCTFGVVLPAFVIILLLAPVLKKASSFPAVQAVLKYIKPCIAGVILAVGISMLISSVFTDVSEFSLSWKAVIIGAILMAVKIGYSKIKKKAVSPILLIACSAVLGMVFYGVT